MLLRKFLQGVLDQIVMLSLHIDPICLAPHSVPAIFPGVSFTRAATLSVTPPVTLERT